MRITRTILTICRLQACRGKRESASQPCSHRREASRSKIRSRSRPRRIRTTQQGAVLAEHSPRRRRGSSHSHIRSLRWLQGSPSGLGQIRRLCRIRERTIRDHSEGSDCEHTNWRGRQTNEGHIPTAVGYCEWILRVDFMMLRYLVQLQSGQ